MIVGIEEVVVSRTHVAKVLLEMEINPNYSDVSSKKSVMPKYVHTKVVGDSSEVEGGIVAGSGNSSDDSQLS